MAIPSDMRPMFAAECEEYLALLAEGFLALEREPEDAARIDGMFRAAHSLKGTARVMGCMDLARATHGLEDLLEGLRAQRLSLSPVAFDGLSRVIDDFHDLLRETLEDGPTMAPADALLAGLARCLDVSGPPSPLPPAPSPGPGPSLATPFSPSSGEAAGSVEVLRVPIARLDALLTQTGELLAAQQRLGALGEAAEGLRDLLEDGLRRSGWEQPWIGQALARAQDLAKALVDEEARAERTFEALESAVLRTRIMPLAALFEPTAKWVRDLARSAGKAVRLDCTGAELELDKRLVEGLREPLLHLLRNAVDHGLETAEARAAAGKPGQGQLNLRAQRDRHGITLVVEDDGVGLDMAAIRRAGEAQGLLEAGDDGPDALMRLLFRPGFSTRTAVSELSGRGVGLDAVATQIAALKGNIHLKSRPGQGTQVCIWVPQSLTSSRVLQVAAGGMLLGLPSAAVRTCLRVVPGLIQSLEGRQVAMHEDKPVLLLPLARTLGRAGINDPGYVVILEGTGGRVALGVDELLRESEVLEKPLPPRLKGIPFIHGLSLLGDGRVLLLCDSAALVAQTQQLWRNQGATPAPATELAKPKSILLADDSLTTRVQLRRILEAAGYQVTPAVDGLDAWSRLGKQSFDAVVSDVQMPGLDGCQLAARIRASPVYGKLPIILVTTLASEEDRRRGLDAGANAYISKGSFDQERLLDGLRQLLPV